MHFKYHLCIEFTTVLDCHCAGRLFCGNRIYTYTYISRCKGQDQHQYKSEWDTETRIPTTTTDQLRISTGAGGVHDGAYIHIYTTPQQQHMSQMASRSHDAAVCRLISFSGSYNYATTNLGMLYLD